MMTMDGNELVSKTEFQRQYLALAFFAKRKDVLERFSVGFDNGFFAQWKPLNSHSSWIFFDRHQDKYAVIGDSSLVCALLHHLGIPESEVSFTNEIPLD